MRKALSGKFACQNMVVAFVLLLSGVAIAGPDQDLLEAARIGDVIKLEQAIEQGASLEATDASGNTALHITAAANHVEALEVLLKQPDADVHARNKLKQTAAHLAAQGPHMLVLYKLQQAGADLHAIDTHGKTPDDYARDAAERSKPSPSRALVKVDDSKQPVWSKQRIKSINKGDVLAWMMRPEECGRESCPFEAFPVVFHQDGKTVFTLSDTNDELLEDVLPDSKVVRVRSDMFCQLVRKTGHGPAGKKEGVSGNSASIASFFQPGWKNGGKPITWTMVSSKSQINKAYSSIKSQGSCGSDSSWSCGPNSAARAMILWGYTLNYGYDDVLRKCPKTMCRKKGHEHYKKAKSAMKWGYIFAPLTLGASMAATSIPATIHMAGAAANSADVGPSPGMLAQFITQYMHKGRAFHTKYNSFSDCANAIANDMKAGDPVIAVFIYSLTKQHYVNVIGATKDNNGGITDFAILDTYQKTFYHSYGNMDYLMNSIGILPGTYGKYNIIRFYKG